MHHPYLSCPQQGVVVAVADDEGLGAEAEPGGAAQRHISRHCAQPITAGVAPTRTLGSRPRLKGTQPTRRHSKARQQRSRNAAGTQVHRAQTDDAPPRE